tara:strand:+ start:1084 stop:2487 length:1404 start_codon:yes stop_codon:yes gene_type:complete
MSEVKVNKISPRTACGTVTLGDSGDSFVIPSGATITNNGTQTGFGRTGTVDWQTSSIKTSDFTAVNTQGFFVDTNGGGVTATLPAGSAGAIVSFQDYRNTFDTHNLIINPNGSEKINGGQGNVILNTEGEGLTLVYIDGTVGWRSIQDNVFADEGSSFVTATGGTITTSGNCKIHTFTGPGTFSVSTISGTPANNEVSYVVVAGGGGGGSSWRSGGGGAGGFRETKSPVTPYTASPLDGQPSAPNRITLTATAFPITVGAGGTGGGPGVACTGTNGANSQFSTIIATGGGRGGTYNPGTAPDYPGQPGGSGGGGGGNNAPANPVGGTGNTPPVSPAQGTDGGNGNSDGTLSRGSGGGGASAAGTPSLPGNQGCGGAGVSSSITGSPVARAGGGGGGCYNSTNSPPSGGNGGGGAGGKSSCGGSAGALGGCNGATNTGGGGGGKAGKNVSNLSGNGGSGVVIIRYKFQ